MTQLRNCMILFFASFIGTFPTLVHELTEICPESLWAACVFKEMIPLLL